MTKDLALIQAQIAKLQAQADALRAKEKADVAAKVLTVLEQYGLTLDDLRAAAALPVAKKRKTAKTAAAPASKKTRKQAVPATAGGAVASKKASSAKATAASKPAATGIGVIRYRDDAGNAWTGRGTRPKWFLAALAAGKSAQDLLVAASR